MNTVPAVRDLLSCKDDSWYAQPDWEADVRQLLVELAIRAAELERVAKFAWLTVSAFRRWNFLADKASRHYFENMQRRLGDELKRAEITLSYLEHRDWPERDLRRAGIADAPVKLLYDRASALIRARDDSTILALPLSDWALEARLVLCTLVNRVETLEQIANQAWQCNNAWQLFRGVGGSAPIGSAHNRVGDLLFKAGIDLPYLAARDASVEAYLAVLARVPVAA